MGETSWDADHRLIGQTDLPMTDEGSHSIADAIRQFKPDSPISLVLVSEEEAAVAVGKLLTGPETRVRTIPELSNVGLGLWEGVLRADLEERCPSAYGQWKEHPERITPPEGESFHDAQDRLISAIVKAMNKAKGTHPRIAIVLRPWAWAIVRCWRKNETLSEIWDQLDDTIMAETIEVIKSHLA
ncbi:MAG: histidine phosphatase family protein, partial [Phycisphaerales bacterium]